MDANTQALLSQVGGQGAPLIISQFFNQITVSTAVTPTLTFPIAANGPPADPATQQLIDALHPTVTLSGPAGSVTVAPYGATQGTGSWWPLALGGLAVVGILGYAVFGD